MKDVSIVMPIYRADKDLMKRIDRTLKKQRYRGKIKIIKVDEGLGLADSLNYGIKKAKTEIVISLHQDCIPGSNNWIQKLVEPLENGAVASVSKVELPYELWKKFDVLARVMSVKEQKILTPLMDEKGCAYKKSVLMKIGLFDGKRFRTAGEDFDMWIRLKRAGKIEYPDCKILHWHRHTLKNRIKKELQLSNGFGALVRIYWSEMPRFWLGFLKAIPIIGWPIFLANFPYSRMKLASLLWIPLSLFSNILYSIGFWKGFAEKKQTI